MCRRLQWVFLGSQSPPTPCEEKGGHSPVSFEATPAKRHQGSNAVVLRGGVVSGAREPNTSSAACKQHRDLAKEHRSAPLCLQPAEPYASTLCHPGLQPKSPDCWCAPPHGFSGAEGAHHSVSLLPAPEHCCANSLSGWLLHRVRLCLVQVL